MRQLMAGFACIVLGGCATTWYSDKFPSEESKQNQLKKDSGYCRAVSHGAVPMPATRIYIPEQQSYNVHGSASGYNGQTGYTTYNYTGTVTPSTSPGSSFASGFAQGMAIGTIARANSERAEVFNACMMNLGWSDKPLSTVAVYSAQKASPPVIGTESPQLTGYNSSKSSPIKLACGVFSDVPGRKYFAGDSQFIYIIDTQAQTIQTSSGADLNVKSWSEREIITDDKSSNTFDTTPPISAHNIVIFDRLTGAYQRLKVWRTAEGKNVAGNDLAAIASQHPLWGDWLVGITESRVLTGDCRVVQQKF
ncbi:MAG: hypothetical protein ACO2ER_04950 [Castellaniella sp.]